MLTAPCRGPSTKSASKPVQDRSAALPTTRHEGDPFLTPVLRARRGRVASVGRVVRVTSVGRVLPATSVGRVVPATSAGRRGVIVRAGFGGTRAQRTASASHQITHTDIALCCDGSGVVAVQLTQSVCAFLNLSARGLLFYRLLQQSVNTDPHPLADLIGGITVKLPDEELDEQTTLANLGR
jgi:hypothetical protein